MAKSKSDISNSAIRIFLQMVGEYYDAARGFSKFIPNKAQKTELLSFFDNSCCYCGTTLDLKSLSQDHLIPLNKEHLGLHAWGNVVPCCRACNNERQHKSWEDFLNRKSNQATATMRKNRILDFVKSKKYDPNLDIKQYAGNLYQDIGAIAMTLIDLRYNQAKAEILKITTDKK